MLAINEVYICQYQKSDSEKLYQLFYKTVHTINAKDYTLEQLNAWTGMHYDKIAWEQSFLAYDTLVAMKDDTIVGFGEINQQGYLNRLYVHHQYQKEGIATLLCDALETMVKGKTIRVHASISAKPFFEKRGYHVVKQQQVQRYGISLTNYVMEK